MEISTIHGAIIFTECCIDYVKNSQTTHDFYAMIQNKFHYIITGLSSGLRRRRTQQLFYAPRPPLPPALAALHGGEGISCLIPAAGAVSSLAFIKEWDAK